MKTVMTNSLRTDSLPFAQHLIRNAHPWWLGPPVFILALIGYCELSSIVSQRPGPGLAISGGWALRIAFGWIAVTAALPRIGPRVARSRLATHHPWTTALACVVGIAVFTLGSEWVLSQLSDRWSSAFDYLYARLPMHLAVAALLVALFARVQGTRSQAAPPASATVAPPAQPMIEVMTGTGHTNIRIDDIEWLKAERNYVSVMHRSGRTYLLRRTMTALEQSLDAQSFVRVHRSIIVNRSAIRERRAGATLVLVSGATVRISRAYRDSV